jgi:glucose dehydrogenase
MIDITQSNTNVKQLGTIHFNGKRDGDVFSLDRSCDVLLVNLKLMSVLEINTHICLRD